MKLWLVVVNDWNGDNFDLFVNADTPEKAAAHCPEYYERDIEEFNQPFRVYEVPTDTTPGPLDWIEAKRVTLP